ncbi:hypothetical protein [Chitinophaga varians]|uniref:hypothetical protein n=1 Tax=Chitinophaga varians TaxID=2202339 RepID=UPI00165EF743|nr:hypothetical protein [Chitinophaga varians]MBC9913173.1 hypothetical protein [Chitinophaga varians]
MMNDYNKVFDDFWRDIVCNPDGSLNSEQVKKELADFKFVMDQVPKVYCHVTGGVLSKVMYPAEVVIASADQNFNTQLELEIKERKEDGEL